MADSLIGSKEVAIAFITFAIANLVQYTGVAFPLTPDQIYLTGVALMAMIRIFVTDGKITTLFPKDEVAAETMKEQKVMKLLDEINADNVIKNI